MVRDLLVWMLYTDLPKEKQDLSVFMSLPQNIHECVRHLSVSRAEGLKLITDKLDELYLQDLNTSAYVAFKEFYSYKRNIGVDMTFWCVTNFFNQKL